MHKAPIDISMFWELHPREIEYVCLHIRYRDLSEEKQRQLRSSIMRWSRNKTVREMGGDAIHEALDYLNAIVIAPGWFKNPIRAAQGFNAWQLKILSSAIYQLHRSSRPNIDQWKSIIRYAVMSTNFSNTWEGRLPTTMAHAMEQFDAMRMDNNQSNAPVIVNPTDYERRFQF